MARHKDINWDLPEGTPSSTGGNTHVWQSIQSALLMDIRYELKRLNDLFHCANFIEVPRKLEKIERNTRKKSKAKKD